MLEVQIKSFGIWQFLLKNLICSKFGVYCWKMNLDVLWNYYVDILDVLFGQYVFFEGLMLFVCGGCFDYIQDSDLFDLEVYFFNYQFKIIDKVGYWVYVEVLKVLLEVLELFLEV